MGDKFWKKLLEQGLEEDGLPWDWTTLGLGTQATRPVKAKVVAKSVGIWAAGPLVTALSDFGVSARSKFKDGDTFRPRDVVCEWSGDTASVLALERTFLNLSAFACGIATRTHELVRIVMRKNPKSPPRITHTRKILPAYRDLAIRAVCVGGGHPHRVSLASGVLIKENHICAAGGIASAVRGARQVAPHGLQIEVEVRNLQELSDALSARADVVMLDNFTPAQVRKALKQLESIPVRPRIEVSGGLNEKTIASYAIPGVDILSVGALTHSVKSADFSLLVKR